MKNLIVTAIIAAATFVVPAFSGTPRNEDVRKMQQTLKDKGLYAGQVDGKLGPQTREALRRYQTDNQLTGEGRFTHDTAVHMNLATKDQQNVGDHFEDAGAEIRDHYKSAGKEVKSGTKAMTSDMKDGEITAGAVDMGKGIGRGAKAVGKGTKDAAVAVGKGVADAFDGKNTEKDMKTGAERSRTTETPKK